MNPIEPSKQSELQNLKDKYYPLATPRETAIWHDLEDLISKAQLAARLDELDHIATPQRSKIIWFKDVFDIDGMTIYDRIAALKAKEE